MELPFQPRGAQIEASYALEDSRAEGAVKGLVQAAAGVGKTYLAAFDSVKYESVLFVAHREEILKQAAVSFCNVRQSEDYGFFDRKHKDTDKLMVFASVATLGRDEYLMERHFKPKFVLGLTATPERMDGRNIYEICDYNVPYEFSLKEAINKGILVPFSLLWDLRCHGLFFPAPGEGAILGKRLKCGIFS